MTHTRRVLSAMALIALALVLAPATTAQSDNTAVREAGKRRSEAQVAFNKAQQSLNLIAQRIRSQHEAKEEWVRAAAAQKNAQRAYDQARAPVLAAVRGGDEYKKLAEQKIKVDEEVARLRDRRTEQDKLTQLATQSVDLSSQMSKLEFDAVNEDPKVSEAKKALNDATTKITELRAAADEAMKSDPEWQEARKLVDEAQIKVTEANKAVADAAKAQADANRASAASRSQTPRRSTPRRSGY